MRGACMHCTSACMRMHEVRGLLAHRVAAVRTAAANKVENSGAVALRLCSSNRNTRRSPGVATLLLALLTTLLVRLLPTPVVLCLNC